MLEKGGGKPSFGGSPHCIKPWHVCYMWVATAADLLTFVRSSTVWNVSLGTSDQVVGLWVYTRMQVMTSWIHSALHGAVLRVCVFVTHHTSGVGLWVCMCVDYDIHNLGTPPSASSSPGCVRILYPATLEWVSNSSLALLWDCRHNLAILASGTQRHVLR